jgi:EAL domain-containing protein (putative c-di-GMP-specific phosphodiesterase class I)
MSNSIIFILLIAAVVLYFFQLHKTSSFSKRKKRLLDVSSRLIDHPVIIFSDSYQVICANDQVQKYIKIRRGDSIKEISSLPFIRIENVWKTLEELIDIYKKTAKETLYLTEVRIKTNTEEDRPVNIHISGSCVEESIQYIGIAIFDISNQLELSKIHYQNTTTGLPNHNKAIADIGLMANKMLAADKKFAVAIISIDHFLEVISTIGYSQSLTMISTIGKYLQKVSHQSNLQLYHMASNNFLLLIPDIATAEDGRKLVDRYKADCEQLLHNKNTSLQFTISSGISFYPDNHIEHLINSAYHALSLATEQGLGYTVIAAADQVKKKEPRRIEYSEIKKALELEQFTLYYQPIYKGSNHTVVSAEALIRWEHPTKGVIPPGQFLPLVEKTGFMKSMGKYVTREAVRQLATWNSLGFRKIQLAINLSIREFEAEDYPRLLSTLLEKNKVDTSQFKVEITENIAMTNEIYSTAQFIELKKLGIGISLDDFGTGYSSFSMLESFPIDTVKIDRSFVTDMAQNKDHYTIVKSMIAMTHALGMKVIAEGIENKVTLTALQELGCDYMQGYYLGKPMPAFEFQELIRSDRQAPEADEIIMLD